MTYTEKFNAAMKHFGYENIKDIPDDKKDDFFEYLDSTHTAKNESEDKDLKIIKKEVDKVAKEILKTKDESMEYRKKKVVEKVLKASCNK